MKTVPAAALGAAIALLLAVGLPFQSAAQGAGQMHNCPPPGKWSIAVWDGASGTTASDALAACGVDAVAAAYSLDPQSGAWSRWFAGKPDLSNLAPLNDMQGVLALGGAAAMGAVGADRLNAAQAGSMQNCPLAGKWSIAVWAGASGTAAGDAMAACGAGAMAAAYSLDSETGAWSRWFAGKPDVSNLPPLNDMQGVLALGAAQCDPSELQGLAYSPFRDGEDPTVGVYPTVEEIREDLTQLRSITIRIRTYGASGTLHDIAQEAAAMGISVAQGVFLSDDAELNEEEIASAVDLAQRGLVQSVIVGNETLLTGVLSESQLLDYIRHVRESVPDTVAVTTAEPWATWLNHPSLVDEVDYVLTHVHPFWEGQSVETGIPYVLDRYAEVRTASRGKNVVIGETGWPSGGEPEQPGQPLNMIPSDENQRAFLEGFIQSAGENCISHYLFSAYDEEWKWRESTHELALPLDRTLSGRFVGSSWGIFDSAGRLKPQLASLFPAATPSVSRLTRAVFDDRGLAAQYDMGVDSSGQRRDWLETSEGAMEMAYPAGQSWGAVFITVGSPVDPPRPWKDFSPFRTLSVELRGKSGNESVEIGIKDSSDPDDGSETKTLVSQLSTEWETYEFPLSSFNTADLEKLYVVTEFVFAGSTAQTVYFRNVRYLR
jgi:exo-beta-1,3-glucanase (GH17 family)